MSRADGEKCLARGSVHSIHSVFMATTDTEKIASAQPAAILSVSGCECVCVCVRARVFVCRKVIN